MNRPPSILVNTGYVTDENGILTELVIPSSVNTLNAPTKIVFMGQTLNYVPTLANVLQEFVAPNMTTLIETYSGQGNASGIFRNYTLLTSVTLQLAQTLGFNSTGTSGGWATGGTFSSCTHLTTLSLPSLQILYTKANNASVGVFANCSGLTTINLPSLQKIQDTQTNGGGSGTFMNCTGLVNVTLGSTGHPVTEISGAPFRNCTQTGLTVTIYTSGGAALAGEPWGATNADIEYEEA